MRLFPDQGVYVAVERVPLGGFGMVSIDEGADACVYGVGGVRSGKLG